jgi:hypothetical protein
VKRNMAEELDKTQQDRDAEADGYYGEQEIDGNDLDLSFLDEDDEDSKPAH